MNREWKDRIRQGRGLAAIIAAVAFASMGCTVTFGGGILPAPAAVYATQGYYATTVSLTWGAVAGASSYNYYCSTVASGSYQYLGTTDARSASVYVPYSSASYYFKVAAANSSGVEGGLSSYATGWAYAPAAPAIFASNDLSGRVYVNWNPVNDAVGYNVYDTTASGSAIYLGQGLLDSSGSFYFYLDTVYPGTYYYRVESLYADNGISALSAEVGGYAY